MLQHETSQTKDTRQENLEAPAKIRSRQSNSNLEAADIKFETETRRHRNFVEEPKRTIIAFSRGDPEDPRNWSSLKKIGIVAIGIVSVINSTLDSSLPSGATRYLARYFDIQNQEQSVLPISLFLLGYVFGPLLFGPLSEAYGRRIIMITTFIFFTIFTLASAVPPTWPALLIFRWLAGMNASSAIAVTGGLYADIYDDPTTRGRAMAVFMAATACGPQFAPIISGFVSVVSWRWTFWVGFFIALVSCIPILVLPETYGPVLLKRRAQRLRKETGNPRIYAPLELEKKGVRQLLTMTLTRPLRMLIFEAIVLFTCLYLALAYAIFYLFFEAYPIIFRGIYGMSTGVSGLAFLPIAVGAFLSCPIFLYWDSILQRAKARDTPWSRIEEYRRLPLACIGGPLYLIALFWLGWTANPRIHWIVPMLAGLPFGIGYLLIFMALLNYLTDAYQIFAASAMAAASCTRSIFGASLPLAAEPMYDRLGVSWSTSLLGFLSLGMTIIPFVFIRYGDRMRKASKFCQHLAERRKNLDEEEDRRDQPSRQEGRTDKPNLDLERQDCPVDRADGSAEDGKGIITQAPISPSGLISNKQAAV